MTHDHFYDGDAKPVTGKSPVQLRVTGGPLDAVTQGGVSAAVNAFLNKARISSAPNQHQTVTLPNGATVRMNSKFGVVTVDVNAPSRPTPDDPKKVFYGGIVIRPYYLTNEAEWLPAEPGTVTPVEFTLPEVTTRGRPAVPTTNPSAATTHLVIQIQNNVPLDDNPVARGYVRIFRIKDPLVGYHAEVSNSPTRYLVSAKKNFSEFYLCGVKLLRVPPLPVTTYTIARIRAHGFVPASFERAANASGFLFAAVDKKLFGLDAGAAVPAWVLLAEAAFTPDLERANDFGDTVSVTTNPAGVTTLVCSGSNGAGVCSTFTVTITPGSPRPTMAGSISLMHDGSTEGVQQQVTYEATLTIDGTNTSGTSMGSPTVVAQHVVSRSDEYTVGAGEMPLITDRFLGGTLPRYPANGLTSIETWACSGGFDGWVDVGGGFELPDWHLDFSYEKVKTELSGTAVTTVTYSWNRVQDNLGSSSSAQSFSHEYPGAISRPADQVERFFYTAKDEHTGKLAWRRDAQRTSESTQYTTQTGPSVGETVVEGFPGDPADTYHPTGSMTTTFSALDHRYELLRAGGAQLLEYANLPALFGATPDWAQTYITTDTKATTDKYGELPSQGGNFWTDISGPTSTYMIASGPSEIPAPLTIRTSPFYYVNWFGPVHIKRGTSESFGVGSPTPYPGGASFSYSITFDGTTPTSFNATDYAAYFAPSQADEVGSEFTPGTTLLVGPTTGTQLAPDSAAFCPPGVTGLLSYGDRVLFDLRTNGFIAWTILTTEMSTGVWARHFRAVIGNDVSMVPLRDVLNEWRNLGVPDPTSDLKIMFYESPEDVSLL